MEAPLGLNHRMTIFVRKLYEENSQPHHGRNIPFQKYYRLFVEGKSLEKMERVTGVSKVRIKLVYVRYFKDEVFHGMSYRAYLWSLWVAKKAKTLPESDTFRLLRKLSASHNIDWCMHREYANSHWRQRRKTILGNGHLCAVHHLTASFTHEHGNVAYARGSAMRELEEDIAIGVYLIDVKGWEPHAYLIPTLDIRNRFAGKGYSKLSLYFPLGDREPAGRTPSLNFIQYRNKWATLRRPLPIAA